MLFWIIVVIIILVIFNTGGEEDLEEVDCQQCEGSGIDPWDPKKQCSVCSK